MMNMDPGPQWRDATSVWGAAPDTETLIAEDIDTRLDQPWRVILFNDDLHTFEEVIFQLVKATGCATERAEELAWQVHTHGKAAVYEGAFEECFRVQGVLREIQLVTEIEG
jgi:ATP-dependent Clp protease adapter protein ClpS